MAAFRAVGGAIVLALGLTATAYFVSDDNPSALRSDVSELFDPLQVGARICGPQSVERAGKFAKLMEVFGARAAHAAVDSSQAPPLWDNLGNHSFTITTSVRAAQAYFDQGLRLSFGFNHAEAVRAFRHAQWLDPECAMCYWGEALALGPNINAPMDDGAVTPALAALANANAHTAALSDKEYALISALSTRYSSDPMADRGELDKAYAAAMEGVAEKFPDDQDVAVFLAEALMDAQPWDYWESDFTTPKGGTARVLAALEGVLAANPDHAGAIHLYIHITEASTKPKRAEPFADRLGALMPGSGHLVHMPSHTYYRIGRFLDSLNVNIAASAADEAYIEETGAVGIYPYAYYPHNVHFVMTSAQMAGDAAHAIEAAEKLDALIPLSMLREVPWTQPIKAAPLFAHAQFSEPDAILALEDPGDAFPFVKAAWHYARGVALAAKGDVDAANAEASAIAAIGSAADFSFLEGGGVPAGEVLKIESHVLLGRIAQAGEDYASAVEHFRQAVAIEDTLAYTEPPYWYYPTRQSLGAALLQAGKAGEARKVFKESLIRVPNNGWALYGLAEAQKAEGDGFSEGQTRKLLAKAWAGDTTKLSLGKL